MRKDGKGLVRAGEIEFLKREAEFLAPRETDNPPPIPTEPEFANPQLSLFQDFLYNRQEERETLSNAVDLWDSVPRYSVSRQAMTKARENGRFLENHTATFQYRDHTYTCTISPARITDIDDGKQRDFYPSANEELVEDALRKLAADQQAGYFDKPKYRSGVVFSLYSLREELSKRGHARSYQEIVMALNILAKSVIEIRTTGDKGDVVAISPYLPSLVAVSRNRLKDDPQAKWAVQFHPFVTDSIDKVTYRQFNYHLMMSHSTQLARWLNKQLVIKYTFAELSKPFEMRYSTIKRDSALLHGYSRERAAIEAVEDAFRDLTTKDILASYERNDITGPRKKILDVIFKIWPSAVFVREVKAANKRLSNAHRKTTVGIGGGSK